MGIIGVTMDYVKFTNEFCFEKIANFACFGSILNFIGSTLGLIVKVLKSML